MSKITTPILAVSAFILTAGVFSTAQLQAGPAHPGDIIIAQGSGGSGGGGAGGSGGGSGPGGGGAGGDDPNGRKSSVPDPSRSTTPSNPNMNDPSSQTNIPARCRTMTNAAERQACINGR